ncbi:unnamed protein product [Calypogeia fissa]
MASPSKVAASEATDAFDDSQEVTAALGRMGSKGSGRSLSLSRSIGRHSGGLGLAPENVSSRSGSRAENEFNDEEALKWAALQRLPTYDRLRTTILEDLTKGSKEAMDLRSLSQNRMHNELVQRLFNNADEEKGNATFLQKLRERIDRAGVTLPTVEVRYNNLNIEAKVQVGGRALPTLSNAALNAIEGFLGALGLNWAKKTDITILHKVSGIIKPGRMTLLLGPPSSGKTSLLLALAGKLDKSLKVTGEVTYNGYKLNEFVPQKTSAYVNQYDLHIAQMTVRETLEYSAKSQDVGPSRYDLLTELLKREKELGIHPEADVDYYMKASTVEETSSSVITDYVMTILGLDICADTIVGNEMVRGISGGQKKRVTIGEMIVGRMKTLFMDEISTGLDSSTTFQIVRYFRDITHLLNHTMLISLLQPAPETYDLFDDVILLSEGQIAYHGPISDILEFFESLGFKCPERKGVADFLQEVTSRKDQEQYWMDKSKPYEFLPVRDIAAAFGKYPIGMKMTEELKVPFDKEKSHKGALSFKRHTLSTMQLVKVNFDREWLLMKRNSFVYVFKFCQNALMAVVSMLIFLRTTMHRDSVDEAQVYAGAIFFGIISIMFNGYAELSMMIIRLPVFYRQRDMLFFPAWCYTVSTWILSIPISIVATITWCIITYYTIGFAPNVSRFFKQLFIFFWFHQVAASLFRIIAGVCRSMVLSNTGGTFSLLVVFALGGFIIQKPDIKPWWIWGYWISPLTYAQNGAMVNEFLAPQWNVFTPGSTVPLGRQYLKSAGVSPHEYWYWIGNAALVGFVFFLNFVFTIALTYLGPLGKVQAVISEEQRAEGHANLTGEILEPSVTSTKSGIAGSLTRSLSKNGSISRKSGFSFTRKSDVQMARKSRLTHAVENESEIQDVRARASNTLSTPSRNSLNLEDANGVAPKRGMILPFQPLSISFDDVHYYVDMPAQMKAQGAVEDRLHLLRGITGAFRPGLLTALVGVSGAGKTTLMDVLAGRKTGGDIEGDIRIAGFPKVQATFARISGYCEQTDIHSPQVTVHESLTYSAWLRLDGSIDNHTKTQFVNEVMDLVELTTLKDALVGLPGVTGLSTEQRKRLTVAVELVANPSIIFMDEPTSGLDARAAAIVMRTVRNTVDTGRTVVCTIHQPSIDIFEAFDELLLMKRGGQVIYAGPLGRHSHKLIEYFEAVPGVPKIKDGYNPATWMLEISSPSVEHRLAVDFAEIYAKSPLFKRIKALVDSLKTPPEGAKDLWFPTQYAQPFFRQVTSCLWKQQQTYWRSPDYINVRFIFSFLAALLFGTLFWQVGRKRGTQKDVIAIGGSIVAAVLFTGINNAATVQPVVAKERTVFYRERAAGMYSAAPYAIAQVLIEVPYLLIMTTMFTTITYAMMGYQWTAAKFFWYYYFMFFSYAYFTFYGMMVVGLTPNHQISAVLASSFYLLWNIFSGYLIPRTRAPEWVRWYYWLSPTAWTLYGLFVTQFGDVHTPVTFSDPTHVPQTVSQYVADYYGFETKLLPLSAIMSLVFAVLFATVFMLSIKFLNFQNR